MKPAGDDTNTGSPVSEFYKTSTVWIVDFRYEGRPRRWFKALPSGVDAPREMSATLRALYGDRVQVVSVRQATDEEESQYLRGDEPQNAYCPTLRSVPRSPSS